MTIDKDVLQALSTQTLHLMAIDLHSQIEKINKENDPHTEVKDQFMVAIALINEALLEK